MNDYDDALTQQRRRDSHRMELAQRAPTAERAVLVIATDGGSPWDALLELARRIDKERGDGREGTGVRPYV